MTKVFNASTPFMKDAERHVHTGTFPRGFASDDSQLALYTQWQIEVNTQTTAKPGTYISDVIVELGDDAEQQLHVISVFQRAKSRSGWKKAGSSQ